MTTWFEVRGFVAEHVFAALGGSAEDRAIITYVRRVGAVLVSKDRDFLELVPPPPQLLHVVVGNATNSRLRAVFEAQFDACHAQLLQGDAIVEMG